MNVKEYLQRTGLKKEKLAKMAGIQPAMISRLLKRVDDKNVILTTKTCERIERATCGAVMRWEVVFPDVDLKEVKKHKTNEKKNQDGTESTYTVADICT